MSEPTGTPPQGYRTNAPKRLRYHARPVLHISATLDYIAPAAVPKVYRLAGRILDALRASPTGYVLWVDDTTTTQVADLMATEGIPWRSPEDVRRDLHDAHDLLVLLELLLGRAGLWVSCQRHDAKHSHVIAAYRPDCVHVDGALDAKPAQPVCVDCGALPVADTTGHRRRTGPPLGERILGALTGGPINHGRLTDVLNHEGDPVSEVTVRLGVRALVQDGRVVVDNAGMIRVADVGPDDATTAVTHEP
jgi:hypothetical protein